MLPILILSLLIGIGSIHCAPTNNVTRLTDDDLLTVCPDGSGCTKDETCCVLASGHYACCPYLDAVCCSDHIHCCPNGHKCDLEHGHCKSDIEQLKDVPCPDGESACPDGNTCCQLEDQSYACCPLEDAVCCSDHLHCCPHGNVCDIEHGRCTSFVSIPWSTKRPAIQRKQQLAKLVSRPISRPEEVVNKDIICPDAISVCNSTSTCCSISDEEWGCCPIAKAICCSDNHHCCPTHYKCDLHIFKCDHELFGSIPLLKKEKAHKKVSSKLNPILKSSLPAVDISTIVCPDESYCPDESTCCQLKNNTYGCCPYENGNCCSDQIHCCGNGYVCDESGTRCMRHFQSPKKVFPMKKLKPYVPKEDQLCPDGITKCFNNATCCPNKNASPLTYSCCPYSKGVCCGSNGSVCCPNDYDCNEDQLSCELRDSRVKRQIYPEIVFYDQCGISNIFCQSDEPCCETFGTSDQDYGCCPYENGVCCSDGGHCCPFGSVCTDVDKGLCLM